jgi:hypothetical protein
MKKYSVHSNTEHYDTDDLKDATEVAHSMAEIFGSSYIIENETNTVVDRF